LRALTPGFRRARAAKLALGLLTLGTLLVPSVATANDRGSGLPPSPPPGANASLPAASAAASCPGANSASGGAVRFVRALICLHDLERRKYGLSRLRRNRTLARAARGHARDMVRRHYASHLSPDGTGPFSRAASAGYGRGRRFRVGENILFWSSVLTPSEVMRKWMRSPVHRGDILRRGWRNFGVGIVMASPQGRRGLTLDVVFGT
jgi:uncharacterized protein YkwD